jgi:hypothetical protein
MIFSQLYLQLAPGEASAAVVGEFPFDVGGNIGLWRVVLHRDVPNERIYAIRHYGRDSLFSGVAPSEKPIDTHHSARKWWGLYPPP